MVRTIGFDGGFDADLRKDSGRGAKDQAWETKGERIHLVCGNGESKVQSVLGRVPRACLECQVEIRPPLHSQSANSILSHTKATSVVIWHFQMTLFLQPSPPASSPDPGSALQEYASKAAAQGPYASGQLSRHSSGFPLWSLHPLSKASSSILPKILTPAHKYSLSLLYFPLEVITIKCAYI